MQLNHKRINLNQLEGELRAVGIPLRALAIADDNLLLVDGSNNTVEPPPQAATVVANHVASVPPLLAVDFNTQSQDPAQMGNAVGQLRTFLANPAPTNADAISALKILIRVVLFMCRQLAGAML